MPGPGVRAPVVAVPRLVQRELHEPRERHRAALRDLGADPVATSASSSPTASGSCGGSRRSPKTGPVTGARPSARRMPGPDQRVAAEDDRDRRVAGGGGQLAQPRVGDPVRQQEVGREPVLGCRPGGLVGPEAVREQHAAVDERRVAERCDVPAQRRPGRRARGAAPSTLAGGRWPARLVRRPRSSISARTRARVARSSHRSVAAEVRPATSSSASRVLRDARARVRAASATASDVVDRRDPSRTPSSGVSRSTWSRHRPRSVRDPVPGVLRQPARQRVVGGRSGTSRRPPAQPIATMSAE